MVKDNKYLMIERFNYFYDGSKKKRLFYSKHENRIPSLVLGGYAGLLEQYANELVTNCKKYYKNDKLVRNTERAINALHKPSPYVEFTFRPCISKNLTINDYTNDYDKLVYFNETTKPFKEIFKFTDEICKNIYGGGGLAGIVLLKTSFYHKEETENLFMSYNAYLPFSEYKPKQIIKYVKSIRYKLYIVGENIVEEGYNIEFFCILKMLTILDELGIELI